MYERTVSKFTIAGTTAVSRAPRARTYLKREERRKVKKKKNNRVLRRDSAEAERYQVLRASRLAGTVGGRRRRRSEPREQPHSGQFFACSRVSLVCNVCSRLLPKEWFAERPMASARANSRVPPPRHLCIIMLSPRTPAFSLFPSLPSLRSLPPSASLPPSLDLLLSACPFAHPPPPSPTFSPPLFRFA